MPGSSSSRSSAAEPELLALTVHRVDTPDLDDPGLAARTRRGRRQMLAVLLICAAPVVASYTAYFVVKPQSRSNYGTLVEPRALPADLALRRVEGGQPVAPAALQGQWLLVVVAPSACDEGCEKRLFLQRQLREMLGRERDRVDKVWLVTDEAPLPPALGRAVADPAAPVTALRADRAALARWLEPASGRSLEDHLYLVDPRGDWMMRMPADPDPARVKRDLERLLRAAAGWDRPGR